MIHNRKVATMVALLLVFAHSLPAAEPAAKSRNAWQAGVSRVVITPAEPMWMSGYGGRSKLAEGKVHDLHSYTR